VIIRVGRKWRLVSRTGKNLGTFDTREEAEAREREVLYFKSKRKRRKV